MVKVKDRLSKRRDDNESPDAVDAVRTDKLVLQTSPCKLHYPYIHTAHTVPPYGIL